MKQPHQNSFKEYPHLSWRGFQGSVEWSEEDGVYFGKVQNIRDLVSYEGETLAEIERDFRSAVDVYLQLYI